ncbi:uncharacterized protein M6B38_269945 [Iris pallida]|uniref:Vacuolar protein sorting-associated protein 62 n=1 Tax=Iris pallida TaxID=29817 RepID=A0AAX6I972_IRIPA|nr:uncharacterized protein M6B38_269945 [Iris pallida]
MGSCLGCLLGPSKEVGALPIETPFKMPSPMPSWPSGDGFADGSIDLGGLEVRQISDFAKVWATGEGGEGDLGATFFAPSSVPDGFFALGSYAQPNDRPLFGWVLVAKDTSGGGGGSLARPVDYSLVWSSESSNVKRDGNGYFWLPVAPDGYRAAGHVVTGTPEKPSLDASRCVHSDFTEDCESDSLIWTSSGQDGVDVRGLRPSVRGTRALGVWVGTFAARPNSSSGGPPALACLKNKSSSLSSMPNRRQVQAIAQAYSPWVYFHPDEPYLPSSVSWFFDNGGLLYQKGNATATRVDSTGSNLPQGGSNDGEYWLDLPADRDGRDRVARGDLAGAEANLHVKPMLGGTFTDVAVWMFYPFNGPARAKVGPVSVRLGRIGEHVGDWEHVTLRVSNLTGELWRVYFSEHSGGSWVDASLLEYRDERPVAYASLNGHAFYPKAGLVLQGDAKLGIGIRNDTARGAEMDTGARFGIVSAEYLGASNDAVSEPPWLNYTREWGPKISYDVAEELAKLGRFLPGKLRRALEDLVKGLPEEVLGEEGPTGPKVKASWDMDETVKS